jgi:hypothetical protein
LLSSEQPGKWHVQFSDFEKSRNSACIASEVAKHQKRFLRERGLIGAPLVFVSSVKEQSVSPPKLKYLIIEQRTDVESLLSLT